MGGGNGATSTPIRLFRRLLERLIPDRLFPDSELRRRARLVALFAVLSVVFAVPFTLVQILFGSHKVMLAPLTGGVVAALVFFLVRFARSVRLGANLLVAVFAVGLTAVTLMRGGFGQPIVMAFPVVPMVALSLGGRLAGRVWLVITLLILCGVAVIQRFFGPLPAAPLADPLATNFPGHLLFVCVCYFFMAIYVYLQRRAMEDQQAVEEQLWESERRRLASETEAQLLRSSRMAELGTLASGVAHEINNPLTYVQSNLDYLRAELGRLPPEEIDQILEETRGGAQRIARIVRDISTFSRVDADESAELVDVHRVLDSSVNLLWNQLKHRATLRRTFGEVPAVLAVTSRLGQVFVNVLTNAVQAIPDERKGRGLIEIRTRAEGAGEDARVVVEIQDDGVGLSPQARSRAFEPFYTSKPVGVGTGLGLSICYGIITKLGGSIRLDSVEGEGTTVSIELPAPAAAAAGLAAPEASGELAPLPGAVRVLVVDDDPEVVRAIGRMLRRHDVTGVTRSLDALERLEQEPPFDVVLCDVMMPELSGIELYERIAGRGDDLASRIIFVTGGAFTAKTQAFLRRTKNLCLEKPLTSEELERAIRRTAAAGPG